MHVFTRVTNSITPLTNKLPSISAYEPSQPLSDPLYSSSVSAPSHPLSSNMSLVTASSLSYPEFDSFFNNAISVDNASVKLPIVQPSIPQPRSTSGVIIPPFYATRKRLLSMPHNVARKTSSKVASNPHHPDETVDAFSDKRRRIDNFYVCTFFSPATDAPT